MILYQCQLQLSVVVAQKNLDVNFLNSILLIYNTAPKHVVVRRQRTTQPKNQVT